MKLPLRLAVCTAALTVLAMAQDKVDLDTIYKIKQEAFQNSQVMDHLREETHEVVEHQVLSS